MRDFACFNELSSLSGRYSAEQLRDFLMQLAQTFDAAWKLGLKKLRVSTEFRRVSTSEGKFLDEILLTLPEEEKGIIYAATDSPHILDSEERQINDFICFTITEVNKTPVGHCEGLLCALIHGVLSISFPSEKDWLAPCVEVVVKKDPKGNEEGFNVPHASQPHHMGEHVVLIGRLLHDLSKKAPSYSDPLPNIGFATKFIANDDWSAVARDLNNCPAGEKIPRIAEMAERVAQVNSYTYEAEISRKNRKISGSHRQIFSCNSPNGKVYLSTDFEKGAFEVCKENGDHLGEWTFDGKKHKAADGSHGIEV